MAQNRKPPAYQEYAATILADRKFRLMTPNERGLFYTMKLECWENGSVPANPFELAKYLAIDVLEIENLLTDNVKSFFHLQGQDFINPELENYRQHLAERREKQSEGGKKGAQKVNSKHFKQERGDLQAPRQGSRESLVQLNSSQVIQTQSLETDELDEWKDDYVSNDNYTY